MTHACPQWILGFQHDGACTRTLAEVVLAAKRGFSKGAKK
jgi:hypothetical protein